MVILASQSSALKLHTVTVNAPYYGHYSATLIIRTSLIRTHSSPANILSTCIESVIIRITWVWRLLNEGARHAFGLENARNDKRRCFYESFWRSIWSKTAVSYQGILKEERKVSISVIRTISLIQYHSMGTLDKGVRIIKVAPHRIARLSKRWHGHHITILCNTLQN